MAVAKKQLVSCKGYQPLMLVRLDTLRRLIRQEKIGQEGVNMSWPLYAWYYDGKIIKVVMYGYEYEKQEDGTIKNTGCYVREIFRTVRHRDAVFAVEFFRVVYNSPGSPRHNWNPRGDKKSLFHKADMQSLKKRPARIGAQADGGDGKGLTISERTGRPSTVDGLQWVNMLRYLGFGEYWRPNLPLTTTALWLQFETWLEDVERYNTVAFDGVEPVLETICDAAQENNMKKMAPIIITLMQDIRTAVQQYQ